MTKLKTIRDVVEGHLCTGCGVCAYLSADTLQMQDEVDYGKRPVLKNSATAVSSSADLIACCPGANLERLPTQPDNIGNLEKNWGNVYEVWEAFAADDQLRYAGSSGGVISALALYCLEQEKMAHVLHTKANPEVPYLNITACSTNKAELLAGTGSRYSPSSPCEKLDLIENASAPCVFIGKPCDVAAVHKARAIRPQLNQNLGVVISFFCAGVPSTQGNLNLLKEQGVANPQSIQSLRYRGNGWPGSWTVCYKIGEQLKQQQLSYSQSWGELQKDRQWRCYICPDHSGEFADIAIGDPWYREIQVADNGRSLIIVRTEKGRQLVKAAAEQGYIVLEKVEASVLPRSQPNLQNTKDFLWGRLFALKIAGAAVPTYKNFALFDLWLHRLTLKEKCLSLLGTIKRVYVKKLRLKQQAKF
jgi:coenzyme F420 hydrogenase subunit beta